MLILNFILLILLVGWWLGTIEVPAGFSGLTATGAIKSRYMGLGIILFVIIGGCFLAKPLTKEFISGFSLTSPVLAVVIAFAASVAVILTYRLSKYASVCYGVIGAVIGWKVFQGAILDYLLIGKILLSWILAPVLSGLFAALLYAGYRYFTSKLNVHILLLIRYLRVLMLLFAALFALLIGINNGALLFALNDTVSPGIDFSWNGIEVKEEYILFILSILIIAVLTWQKAALKIKTMSEGEFDANIESILITLISATFVLSFFSIPAVCQSIGLPLTPISVSGVVIGGFAGINLLKKGHGTEYSEEVRLLLAILATPVVAFILTYFVLHIIDIQVLLPDNDKFLTQSRDIINITPVITTTLILGFATFIIVYLRKQRRIRMQAEIILLENQNKLFENQKAMSALEIRTVITENEQLSAKLEFRRKELINIALGITEQKNFQESLYHEIKSLKNLDDPEELKHGIEKVEKQLLQKMNYSQELESFYAQIETLHKDFNMRLTEKFPNLTEQERRLTTLLRLGFSSKHIASLMNISPKSVEMSRYRLRNRLELEHDQNLINFIKNI